MTLAPGTTLGPYEVQGALGAGGMGEVWRARDTRLERDVALKVLPAETLADETARARLVREARLASQLNHPHICTIYEVGDAGGRTFIAMELVEGQTLTARVAGGALPVGQVLRYGQQLAQALGHAHSRGVVHRDFKSQNVVVTPEDQVKVLDFGLAKRLTTADVAEATTMSLPSLTEPGVVAGTLAYMAPEQLQGKPADARSDIWALGVVLYEIVTGKRPFQGRTGFELSSAILSHPLTPLPSSVPAPLAAVIDRCLAKEPGARYQRGDEVRAALEAIQAGGVDHALTGRKSGLSRRALLALTAGLAAALVVVGALSAGLGLGVLWDRLRSGAATSARHSIAVLPFVNLSGDPDQEFIADGMTDALIADLSRIRALRVTSLTSAMKFKGARQALPEIARALKAKTLLTGSVIREADRVSIRAQLYDAAAEQQLWTESYVREFSSLLVLQGEVARAVAGAVRVRLRPDEETRFTRPRQVNSAAYEAYLRGMAHLNKGTLAEAKNGLACFEEAVAEDPADPLAYAGLALAHVEMAHSAEARTDSLVKAKAAAATALKLDDSLAEVYAARAMAEAYLEWNWDAALRDFDRALDVDPSLAVAYFHRAWLHLLFGRMGQAEQDQLRAWELDPFNPEIVAHVGALYSHLGRADEAIAEGLKTLEMAPEFPLGYAFLADSYGRKGMYDEAIAAAKKAGELSPRLRWYLGRVYAAAGRKEEARAVLAELSQAKPSPFGALGRAQVCIALGDMDEAFRWLNYEPHHAWVPWTTVLWGADALRKDPRFPELRRRWNLPPQPASASH